MTDSSTEAVPGPAGAAWPAAEPRPTSVPLPRLGWRTLLLFAAIYLYSFPFLERLRSANEMPRLLTTQVMVDHGRFWLDDRLHEMSSRFDTSLAPNGHTYQNKAPGPSFLAVPVYLVCKLVGAKSLGALTWAFRVFVVTIPTLLFLVFFYRLLPRFAPQETAQRTALLAFALASPAFPYALLFFSHDLAAVAAGGSFVAAVTLAREQSRRPFLVAVLVGVFAGLAVMMDYQTILASALVALYVLVRAPHRLRNVAGMMVGAAPSAIALGAYHTVCFGGPLTTGYTFAADTVTRLGFLGIVGPSWESFNNILFLPANGLFVLAPWTLIAIVGLVVTLAGRESRQRAGVEAVTCFLVFVVFVVFLGSLAPSYSRAGWCVGPRYMTMALPFVAWLAAPGFAAAERWLATRVLAHGLVLASVVIFVVGSIFPHWPDGLQNPLYEMVFRLVDNGFVPHSLGTAAGLRGFWAMLPMWGLALGLALRLLTPRRRLGRVGTALACVLAAAIVVGHRSFPLTGPYAERAYGYVTGIWEPPP